MERGFVVITAKSLVMFGSISLRVKTKTPDYDILLLRISNTAKNLPIYKKLRKQGNVLQVHENRLHFELDLSLF